MTIHEKYDKKSTKIPIFNLSINSQNLFDIIYHSMKNFIKETEEDIWKISGKIKSIY